MGPKNTTYSRSGPDALVLHLLQSMVSAGRSGDLITAQQKMHDMLAGIRRYQTCGVPPVVRDHAVIWQRGPVRLLHVKAPERNRHKSPVILIPSLVNGWEILDLLPEQSFARYLQQKGFDVHIIDWGDLREEPDIQTLPQLLFDILAPMVRMVSATAGSRVITMGYCMGGLLMAGAVPEMRAHLAAQVYLATPWDFHTGDPYLTRLVRAAAPQMLSVLQGTGYWPNTQVQMLFASVDPDMAIQKFARFYGLAPDDPAYAHFVAVEDWLQTGRDLPRDIALVCLRDWYLQNKTGQGSWQVGVHPVTASTLSEVPSLVVAPARDRLVETQTAQALARAMGRRAKLLTPDIGHIGMMASARAAELAWDPVVSWLAKKI